MGEKTELPTPKRLEEARRKGSAPRSRLWTGGCACLAALVGVQAAVRGEEQVKAWAVRLWTEEGTRPPAEALATALKLIAKLSLPALLAAALAGWLASVVTSGWQLRPEGLSPKLERLNPAAGLKRLWGAGQLPERFRDLALLVLLIALGASLLPGHLFQALRGMDTPGIPAFAEAVRGIWAVMLRAVAVLAILGVADLIWSRQRHRRSLMMSRDEVRRESKESEGDPQLRSHRRSLHRALAQGGPSRGLKTATVLVVNPTHVAVALRYDELECGAPYLVAKALDEGALQLKAEARRLRIPIVPNVALARGLYVYDVGEAVPEELYRAAAAVLQAALESKEE